MGDPAFRVTGTPGLAAVAQDQREGCGRRSLDRGPVGPLLEGDHQRKRRCEPDAVERIARLGVELHLQPRKLRGGDRQDHAVDMHVAARTADRPAGTGAPEGPDLGVEPDVEAVGQRAAHRVHPRHADDIALRLARRFGPVGSKALTARSRQKILQRRRVRIHELSAVIELQTVPAAAGHAPAEAAALLEYGDFEACIREPACRTEPGHARTDHANAGALRLAALRHDGPRGAHGSA